MSCRSEKSTVSRPHDALSVLLLPQIGTISPKRCYEPSFLFSINSLTP